MMSKLEAFFNRPIGIFNWVLSRDPAQCAELACQHGFSCIQWGVDLDSGVGFVRQAEDAQAVFADQGLPVVALAGYQNLVAHDPEEKSRAYTRLEQYIEISSRFPHSAGIATETGTKNRESQWHGHPDNLKPETWDEMITGLKELSAKAKAAGTRILIEGYVENVIRTAEDISRLKSEVDMDGIGFVMDPFNLFLEEKVPLMAEETGRIFDAMGRQAPIAHAKDLLYTDGIVATPRSGTGMFDYKTYFKLLDEKLPGVPLILEHLEAHEVDDTLDFLKTQYEHYKNS